MPDESGAADLSKIPTRPEFDLEYLSPEDQARIDALAEKSQDPSPEPVGEPVRTAFLVIVGKDGSAGISPDLDFKVVREYLPSTDDVYGAVQLLARNIEVAETANGTAQMMQMLARQQMEAMRQQQMIQGLNLGKGPQS